jgi:hypothetical protein
VVDHHLEFRRHLKLSNLQIRDWCISVLKAARTAGRRGNES